MGKVENPGFPRMVGCGLRKLSINHLLAARLAEQARGLPAGVKHPNQLLAALRRAAPRLGYRRLLPLMETLFRWTQPQDWAPEAAPIVWPSNEALAAALDCSERHVSRLIAAAIEARLITAKDGADRKRRGARQDGRILWAWGLDLRPMAARHAEFLEAAAEAEEERRLCRELRRRGSRARQQLTQLLSLAQERGWPTMPLEQAREEADRLVVIQRRAEGLAQLSAVVEQLEAVAAQGAKTIERTVETADMSGSADSQVRSIIPTNPESEPKGSTVEARREAPAEKELRISPAGLASLAPKLRDFLASAQPGWGEISDAAAALAEHLSIPQTLYGDACRRLGRPSAAAAIAIISCKSADHFHSAGPAGYLRGMLRRAERGELHLERSLHGLRSKEAAEHRQKLTAVNTHTQATSPVQGLAQMRYSGINAWRGAFLGEIHG